MNNVKTVGLLTLLAALLGLIGYSLGGSIWWGLGVAAVFNLGAYFFSDKMALAASHAKPVEEHELPQVYAIVRNLTTQQGMPMPRMYIIDSPQPNAFATGRNPSHAAVAVTRGILQIMNYDELQGVLAHELSHVKNRDILISSIAAMIGAAISIIARMAFWFGGGRDRNNPLGAIGVLLALIVGPLAAMFIRMGISRAREYQADRSGAEMTGQPMQLASALAKISEGTQRIPMRVDPAVSQLFIDNPLKAMRGRGMMNLLSTHPPVEDRIERLRKMQYGG